MKVLCIGDPHIREKRSEIVYSKIMVDELIRDASEESPELIVVLGDTLDTFGTVKLDSLHLACYLLTELGKIATTYVLIGNHDRKNNKDFLSDYHPFVGFYHSEVHIICTVKEINHDSGYHFVFVPYVYPGRFQEALDTINCKFTDKTIIFAHQEFKGVEMGSIKSEEGDEWSLDNPLVITGHIHGFCILQKNIVYPGTPAQQTFAESTDKGPFYLLVGETDNKHKRINGMHSFYRKKIKTVLRITYSTTCQKIMNDEFLFQEKVSESQLAIFRLEIKGTREDISALLKSKKLKKYTSSGVKIKWLQENGEDEDWKIVDDPEYLRFREFSKESALDRIKGKIMNDEETGTRSRRLQFHSELCKYLDDK